MERDGAVRPQNRRARSNQPGREPWKRGASQPRVAAGVPAAAAPWHPARRSLAAMQPSRSISRADSAAGCAPSTASGTLAVPVRQPDRVSDNGPQKGKRAELNLPASVFNFCCFAFLPAPAGLLLFVNRQQWRDPHIARGVVSFDLERVLSDGSSLRAPSGRERRSGR